MLIQKLGKWGNVLLKRENALLESYSGRKAGNALILSLLKKYDTDKIWNTSGTTPKGFIFIKKQIEIGQIDILPFDEQNIEIMG